MKTIKVSEATGPALNWLVHQALGGEHIKKGCTAPPYATDWCFGGPIIGQEGILFHGACDGNAYNAWIVEPYAKGCGATHLIAAMRCFGISTLGETVEVPEELT